MRHAVKTAVLALLVGSGASAQTMYRCQDEGKTIYSDKPCLTGVEVKRMGPNGGPTPEEVAKGRMRFDAERQREMDQQRARAANRGAAAVAVAGTKVPAAPGK
jgi:hypothetical protein